MNTKWVLLTWKGFLELSVIHPLVASEVIKVDFGVVAGFFIIVNVHVSTVYHHVVAKHGGRVERTIFRWLRPIDVVEVDFTPVVVNDVVSMHGVGAFRKASTVGKEATVDKEGLGFWVVDTGVTH